MSDSGGGGTPTSTPADGGAPQGPAPADPALRTGPRRSAPGLSSDRGGMTLSQGVAALRRASAAPVAPAADQGGDTVQPTAPVRRAAPSQPAPTAPATRPAPFSVGADRQPGQQQQQEQPQRQPAPTRPAADASPLDAIMERFLQPDGADPQPRQPAEMQPAPTNAYLQGVPLKIGNEERHFSVPELTEAVSKASDYTRKTAALAEQARALNERTQTIDQLLPILIPEIERQLAAMTGPETAPDWVALAADPAEYARQHAAWSVRQQQREAEQARLAQIQQANAQRVEQQRMERVRISHAELARTLPGWADAATRTKLVGEMRTWGMQNGYPAAELDSVVEARHITTLAKAMMFDRIMANARTTTLNVPQVRRGATPQPPAPAAIRTANERFEANPTVKTGVGLLMARRHGGRMNGAA
jgi:hypothetical protein